MEKGGIARTSGDGMEQEAILSNEDKYENLKDKTNCRRLPFPTKNTNQNVPGKDTIYRPEEYVPPPLPPVIPKGKIYYLVPKLQPRNPSVKTKIREPRFVPLEPYKAAVSPLVPLKKHARKIKVNKNNLDINVLVSQMAELKTTQADTTEKKCEKSEIEIQKEMFEMELSKMREEKAYLQSQLKFQVQVNAELKNLLVAAVGEDIQTKVNVLTEDKLQLARALLDSANNLSTHTEQIEYLAGQCEVWRSKFLASSVMIEELARWKADLSHKNKLLTESSKKMLQLVTQVREMEIDILKNLKFLSKLKTVKLPSSNVTDLSSECLNISQNLVLHSGIGMPETINLDHLETLTQAELLSIQALDTTSRPLISTEEASRAIVGQAFPSIGTLKNSVKISNNEEILNKFFEK